MSEIVKKLKFVHLLVKQLVDGLDRHRVVYINYVAMVCPVLLKKESTLEYKGVQSTKDPVALDISVYKRLLFQPLAL